MKKSEVVSTERGCVEYILEGKGPVVLIVHGGHGNCYADYKQHLMVERGFSVLTPTRPGYGRTPIGSGKSATDTADLFASLLKTLDINKVRVIGNSAGGPVALEFARRYPGLTEKLVLEAAVVKPWFHRLTVQYYGVKVIFRPGYQRKFWEKLRRKLEKDEKKVLMDNMKRFTKMPAGEVIDRMSESDIEVLKEYMVTGNDSGTGFIFDVEHRARHIERIFCPTLIIHSKNDGSVPYAHAEYACKKIRNSVLFPAPTDSHFIYLGPGSEIVLEKRLQFLTS